MTKAAKKGPEFFSELKAEGITAFYNKFNHRTLASKNFDVSTIIDVGVFKGTSEIYRAFPTADIVLVDPIPKAAAKVAEKLPNRKCFAYDCAAGSGPGTAQLKLNQSGGKSSLLDRADRYPTDVAESVDVEIKSLDNIILKNGHKGPFGLKIDAEGFELEVLKGAQNVLPLCSFAIIETSVKRRFADSYRFSEIVAAMARHDFEILDVLNAAGREPYFFDCLFVPVSSPRLD